MTWQISVDLNNQREWVSEWVLIIYIFLPITKYITGLSSKNDVLYITLAHLPELATTISCFFKKFIKTFNLYLYTGDSIHWSRRWHGTHIATLCPLFRKSPRTLYNQHVKTGWENSENIPTLSFSASNCLFRMTMFSLWFLHMYVTLL